MSDQIALANMLPPPTRASQINRAAWLLSLGQLVAFPTETVYGLGGDAHNPEAIRRIYAVKGRPEHHPVIVHLPPDSDPVFWVKMLPIGAQKLIDAFWPGPLTLILKRATHIPAAVSCGHDSIGLRCPSHPIAQALLTAFSVYHQGHGGVAAPSANRFRYISPTTAQHVHDEFGDTVHILDGGPSEVGIESTILDLSRDFPTLLRPGYITPQDITEVLGEVPRLSDGFDITAPPAPGTLEAHYAPHTPLILLPFEVLEASFLIRRPTNERVALIARFSPATSPWAIAKGVYFISAPKDPHTYARELYGSLRALDRINVTQILIEKPPDTIEWIAVNDRLRRAAAFGALT